jgi:hypothetical protein
MKSLPWLLLTPCFLLAGLTLLGQAISLSGPPDAPHTLSGVARQILQETFRQEDLARHAQVLEEMSAAKQSITRKLIAERISLKEALRAFSEIDRASLEQTNALEGNEYLLSEQQVFEHLLGWVEGELHSRPCQAYDVAQRLQDQWQALHAHAPKTDPDSSM